MSGLQPTARNRHRTSSRNSLSVDKLMRDANVRQLPWVLYQYCATCLHIEGLVLSATTPSTVRVLPGVKRLAESLKVPVIIIEHTHRDEEHRNVINIHMGSATNDFALESIAVSVNWSEAAKYLNGLHGEHAYESECPKSNKLLEDGTWKTTDGDASISNVARQVPGVRHIDIDASVYCPRCYSVPVLVEASSTGMKGTSYEDQVKAVKMTRRIAKSVGASTVLLQHHPQDDNHKNPVMITLWKPQANSPEHNQEVSTWGNMRRMLKTELAEHQRSEVCGS